MTLESAASDFRKALDKVYIDELKRVGIDVIESRRDVGSFTARVNWDVFDKSDYRDYPMLSDDWTISCFVNDTYRINIIISLGRGYYYVDIFDKEEN